MQNPRVSQMLPPSPNNASEVMRIYDVTLATSVAGATVVATSGVRFGFHIGLRIARLRHPAFSRANSVGGLLFMLAIPLTEAVGSPLVALGAVLSSAVGAVLVGIPTSHYVMQDVLEAARSEM